MCSGYKQIVTNKSSSSRQKSNTLDSMAPLKEQSSLNRRAKTKRRCPTREEETKLFTPPSPCKRLKVNQLYSRSFGRNSFIAAFFRLFGKQIFRFTTFVQSTLTFNVKFYIMEIFICFAAVHLFLIMLICGR